MAVKRLIFVVLWILFTVATSWYVARQVAESNDSSITINPVSTVAVVDREVVGLSEQFISPVISANALIQPNQDGDGWILEAQAPSDAIAYQLLDEPQGVKALINGGPKGFDCEWIGLGYTGGGITSADSGSSKAAINDLTNRAPLQYTATAGESSYQYLRCLHNSTLSRYVRESPLY